MYCRSDEIWEAWLDFPPDLFGEVEIKYIVDGEWMTSPHLVGRWFVVANLGRFNAMIIHFC